MTWSAAVRRVPSWSYPLIFAVALALLPILNLVGFAVERQIQLALLLAMIVSGLNLGLGYAGQLVMGQPAMYAAGAYAAAMMSKHVTTDLLAQLAVGGVTALVVGVITGVPGLRLGSWSLGMTSFFLVLLIPDLTEMFREQTGGTQGFFGINAVTLFGQPLEGDSLYIAILVVCVVWFAVFRNVVVSRHGTAFRVLKESPVLASSLGISVFRMKLLNYAVGAIPAGLAGVMFANLDLYISPDAFGFHLLTMAIAASVLGGSASVYGAVVGAFILQFGTYQASAFQAWALIVFGAYLVLSGVLLRGGLAEIGRRIFAGLDDGEGTDPIVESTVDAAVSLGALPGATLAVEDVSKSFGGNRALVGAEMVAVPGKVTALIGPNGSGKTTLLNMIGGFYTVDSGGITLDGESITSSPSDAIARRGIARTFQTPVVPQGITVREAASTGRYTTQRASLVSAILRLPRFNRLVREDHERVDEVLAVTGLTSSADVEAAALPLGMRRMLEVARALIARPRVLLLDEAASGLDEDEVERLAGVIRLVRDAGGTVVLVEHNYKLVLSLADEIYVLARGSLLAHGTPEEIERNESVQREYLGAAVEVEILAELDDEPSAQRTGEVTS